MDIKLIKEVIDCLPEGRTGFNYQKDRYAAYLLSQLVADKTRVADLKKSKFAGLLNKPMMKDLLAQSGDGFLYRQDLEYFLLERPENFLLSLDTWGDGNRYWDQVSRAGHNLVLQMNFSNKHQQIFEKLLKPDEEHCFSFCSHPVMQSGKREFFRETLAWARIDFDFETGEALIEELQTDWLRTAKRIAKQLQKNGETYYSYGTNTTPIKMKHYVENILSRYGKIWDEAMLTASIQFIREELGIDKIYLHTPDTGAALKKITYTQPPRSLYTSLPRKFCFKQTDEAPEFLSQSRGFRKLEKKLGGTQWNFLNMPLQ